MSKIERFKEPRATGRQAVSDKWSERLDKIDGAPPIQLTSDVPNEFPARLIPKDPRDRYVEAKELAYEIENEKVRDQGKSQIVRTVTDADIDYAERKRNVLNRLQYDKWLTTAIDLKNPTDGKHRAGRGGRAGKAKLTLTPKKTCSVHCKGKRGAGKLVRRAPVAGRRVPRVK